MYAKKSASAVMEEKMGGSERPRIDVERAGGRGLACERGDAEADEDHQAHRDQVGDGRALAGEDEDQRNRELRGGAGSDGGDGLGEGFERRESVVAEAEGLGCG